MTGRSILCSALLAATACADFPRDPDGTLDRIRGERSFRVGLVAPLGERGFDPKVQQFLQQLRETTGASAKIESGDGEPLLNRLKEGDLDLVIGRFESKSPWARLVTIGPPLHVEKHGKADFHLAPVMRNGENGWIALVERKVRGVAPEAQ